MSFAWKGFFRQLAYVFTGDGSIRPRLWAVLFYFCWATGRKDLRNRLASPALKRCGAHWRTRKEHQAQREQAFTEMNLSSKTDTSGASNG